MIDWIGLRGLHIRREPFATVTLAEGQPEEGMTLRKLADAVFEVERIMVAGRLNPMAGVRHLYAHDNMMDAARKLADAAHNPPYSMAPMVHRSELVPPGHIVGMGDGQKTLLVIGPDNPDQQTGEPTK